MFSHKQMWDAIDALAARNSLSTSGLAKRAGLDATTFNKSKRLSSAGHMRWPTTESLSRILDATRTPFHDFVLLVNGRSERPAESIPLIGFAKAGEAGLFDDGGAPTGTGWEQIAFPKVNDACAFALEISGDGMLPVYRDGDTIIVSPNSQARRGDRVVVRTKAGEVLAKVLARQTARTIEFNAFSPNEPPVSLGIGELAWIARIVWASQ
jgi:phage repressor protein C with HTH and peptisase S24 domain